MSLENRFTVLVSKEREWYVAHCIELGLAVRGDTLESSKQKIEKTVSEYVHSYGGRHIPSRPVEMHLYKLEV